MDAVTPRIKRTVYKGDLTGIQRIREGDRIVAVTATISRMIKGVVRSSPIRVSGEALARVGHMFEPGHVAFYGEVLPDGFNVIGPDLRRKTLSEAQAQARRPRRAYRSPSRIARDRYFAARARAARLTA
jgi:hypothetical protein